MKFGQAANNTQVAQEATRPGFTPKIQNFPMPVAQTSAATQVSNINISTLASITEYGAKEQEKVSAFADKMLAEVQSSKADVVGEKLGQIVSLARSVNITDLNGRKSKIPLIGKFIDKLADKKAEFASRFDSVKTQIDKLVVDLTTAQQDALSRNEMLEQMYAANMDEYRTLDKLVKEGKEYVAEQRNVYTQQLESAKASGAISDPEVAQSYSDWLTRIDRFDKRVSDLEVIQMMAVHAMPEIRLIQSNNLALIDKFNDAKTLVIPNWKKQFVLAIQLEEQSKGAALATSIDDASNEFYRNKMALLGKNTQEIARANQRSVLDIETLQAAQSTLLETFDSLTKIADEGKQSRARMSTAIHEMKKELHNKSIGKNQS